MGAIVIYGDRSDSSLRAQVRSLDVQSDTADGQERFRARPWINRVRGSTRSVQPGTRLPGSTLWMPPSGASSVREPARTGHHRFPEVTRGGPLGLGVGLGT